MSLNAILLVIKDVAGHIRTFIESEPVVKKRGAGSCEAFSDEGESHCFTSKNVESVMNIRSSGIIVIWT